MNNTLYIPKKLNVGFQERNDTYSGLLGYVIYWDDKGVLRKEGSWESWRHKPGNKKSYQRDNDVVYGDNVAPQVLDNEPMEGFVLNKQIGGARYSYGWNARIERVRVWDPRGFEFEISIPNLLFILQETTSSKGKGLEGKFVYSWAGKELVLLPTESQEYKESTKYTNLQGKKVTAKEMLAGKIYTFKDKEQCIYLGRHECILEFNYNSLQKQEYKKYHVFVNTTTGEYRYENGFTKLATVDSENIVDNYSDLLETFTNTKYYTKVKRVFVEEFKLTPEYFEENKEYSFNNFLIETSKNQYTYVTLQTKNYNYVDGKWIRTDDNFSIYYNDNKYFNIGDDKLFNYNNNYNSYNSEKYYYDGSFQTQYNRGNWGNIDYSSKKFDIPYYPIDEAISILNCLKLYTFNIELDNGKVLTYQEYCGRAY
jgi:hypothetical protein